MKYSELFILLFLISCFSVILSNCIKQHINLTTLCNEYKEKSEANLFITESFKNTCAGKGFSSLFEWQKKCKAMWDLEYIAWSKADEFMLVKEEMSDEIMYGTWKSEKVSGEVYCKKNKDNNYEL